MLVFWVEETQSQFEMANGLKNTKRTQSQKDNSTILG